MLKGLFRTPRSTGPLPAVLVGAGFFFFLAALTSLGPFRSLDLSLWRAVSPGQARPVAQAALRVLGRAQILTGTARVQALGEDLVWLRRAGAGVIVVEAWLDEVPLADAKELAEALFERFQFLDRRTKAAALAALTETTQLLDLGPYLSRAVRDAQPLILPWQAVPGTGEAPERLRRQGYEVTLRGERQSLPERQAAHVPWEGVFDGEGRVGVCAPAFVGSDEVRVPAVVEMRRRWFNALGLEAARIALGLPLEGLRYRWRKGALSSLEMKGVRYPLDTQGRLLLPERLPELPSVEIERLRSDAELQRRLQGKVVFFRPWPRQLGDAELFDQQTRLFSALVERRVYAPPATGRRRVLWTLGWGLGVLGLAFLPVWAAVPAWLVLPWMALQSFSEEPQELALPLSLAFSALLLGLGWRLQRWRRRDQAAGLSLLGRVAPAHQAFWRRRLGDGHAGLEATYAVVGPRALLQGAAWDAWVARWGPFLDLDLPLNGLGLVFAATTLPAWAALDAMDELRGRIEGLRGSLGLGMLAFDSQLRMGAVDWKVHGPGKDRALALFERAKTGQWLILESDYAAIRERVQIQLTGQKFGPDGEEGSQVLNLLVFKVPL
jgi:hypothetical protein